MQNINKGTKKGTGLDEDDEKVDVESVDSSDQQESEDGKAKGSKEKDAHKKDKKKQEKHSSKNHKAEAAEDADEFEDARSWGVPVGAVWSGSDFHALLMLPQPKIPHSSNEMTSFELSRLRASEFVHNTPIVPWRRTHVHIHIHTHTHTHTS